jgi:hypothetical protein
LTFVSPAPLDQGCQMEYFHTKNPNFHNFWRASEWKTLVYVCYGHLVYVCYDNLVYLVVIWYIFPVLVSYTKKNLALDQSTKISSLFNCRICIG